MRGYGMERLFTNVVGVTTVMLAVAWWFVVIREAGRLIGSG